MKNFKQKIVAKKLAEELSIKDGVVKVNQTSCDGCTSCVDVCPFSAISIKSLSSDEVKELPFKGRLKVWIKGNSKATINTDACTSCGLCMKQCHEFAIHKQAI
ncbi:4Fe-4S binding protein [Saccharicrinis aurantiacus]|uniref:4Fe-4S binding protein n=1 Tax=Saccharicrinis aurantiacus TaxID=1849719 RepID=UPI0009F85B3E|nr:4Fe-4S binding protein [Saccharicrinis aurantiacus]